MNSNLRMRFWVEAGLASLSAGLALLTFVWEDWIEALTGFEPDAGSGSFEWAIVGSMVLASVVLGLAARGEWRRASSVVGAA